jgi:hypothetical protein
MAGLRRAALGVVGAYGFAGNSSPPVAAGAGAAPGAPAAAPAPAGAVDSGTRAASAAPEHSGTNVAEPGVDEPDLVKTDGRRIVTVVGGVLRVFDAASRQQTGALPLPFGDGDRVPYPQAAVLLLHGDRALVLSAPPVYRDPVGGPVPAGPGAPAPATGPVPATVDGSWLLLVDLSGPPRLLGRLAVDGQYLDARQVGGTVRVVARSGPRLRFGYPDGNRPTSTVAAENRKVVQRSTPADWLPRYDLEVAGHRSQGQVPCDRVVHPAAFTGSSLLTVYTVDLAGAPDRVLAGGDPVTIAADGDTVYGTAASLFIATDESWRGNVQRTEVHRFDVSGPGRPRYAASGAVPGSLLNQYAMSEYQGHLRIATTTTEAVGPGRCCGRPAASQSAVRVLDQRGDALVEVGRLDGLGKGERLYAVRFVGPVGYAVTFRQTDPLYTLDLRDPRHPSAVGELTIRGYSAYLHPAGYGRLIGVGQDATAQGRRLGAQVSLFDVIDPARPARVARYQVPGGYSAVESDPHAFLYWPAAGLVVVPVAAPDLDPTGGYAVGALALSLRGTALGQRGMVRHPPTGPDHWRAGISRALVVGDALWTLSDAGLQANDLQTLARRAWLPFG